MSRSYLGSILSSGASAAAPAEAARNVVNKGREYLGWKSPGAGELEHGHGSDSVEVEPVGGQPVSRPPIISRAEDAGVHEAITRLQNTKGFKDSLEDLAVTLSKVNSDFQVIKEEALRERTIAAAETRSQLREKVSLRVAETANLAAGLKELQDILEVTDRELRVNKTKVCTLEKAVEKLIVERDRAVQETRQVNSVLEKSKSTLKEQDGQLMDLRAKYNYSEEALKRKETEIQGLKAALALKSTNDQVKDLETRLEAKSQDIEQLSKKLHNQEERIKKAQRAALGSLGRITHTFLDDTQATEELQKTFIDGLDSWVRKYIPKKATSSIDYDSLSKEVVAKLRTVSDARANSFFKRSPRVPVLALLNDLVARTIFNPPFFLFSSQNKAEAVMLESIYNSFSKDDETRRQAWRFYTFHLLSKTRAQQGADGEAARVYAEKLARDFIAGLPDAFFGPTDDATRGFQYLSDKLRAILALSVKLWSQRVVLEIRGYDYFKDEGFYGSSRDMRPHPFHDLEEAPNSADGSPIILVVQPEIVVHGNEEGQGYDKYRVWIPAIVGFGET